MTNGVHAMNRSQNAAACLGVAASLAIAALLPGPAFAGECRAGSSGDLKNKVTSVDAQTAISNGRLPDRNVSARILSRTTTSFDALDSAEWQTVVDWTTVKPGGSASYVANMPAPASSDVSGNSEATYVNTRVEFKPPAAIASCEHTVRTLVYANNERLTDFVSASCTNPDGSPVAVTCAKSLNNRNSDTPRWEVTYKVMEALTPTAK
jgi:hypothetical protein